MTINEIEEVVALNLSRDCLLVSLAEAGDVFGNDGSAAADGDQGRRAGARRVAYRATSGVQRGCSRRVEYPPGGSD